MIKKAAKRSTRSIGSRKAGLIAGLCILAMIYPAMEVITMLEDVLVKGNAAQTTQNVLAAGGFGLGTWAMLGIVVMLDVAVSIGLWRFFAPAASGLARAVMITRLAYTAIFGVAILQLASAASDPNQSLVAITRFNDIWHVGLLVFGAHLALIGGLLVRLAFGLDYLHKATGVIVGGLLLVAGVGYLIDDVGLLFVQGYETATVMMIALATGEALFALWLVLKNLGFFGIPTLVRKLKS